MNAARSRILVAEDSPGVVRMLSRALRRAGYTVLVARDGSAASMLARAGLVDLVLLDLSLPERDGFDVLADLRLVSSPPPVIVLTARDDPDGVVLSLEAGAVDHVTKPFALAELLARVALRLNTRGSTAVVDTAPHAARFTSEGDPAGLAETVAELRRKIGAHRIETVGSDGYRLGPGSG